MFRSMSEWCLFAPQNKPLDYNTLRKAIITFLGKNHITYKKSIKKGQRLLGHCMSENVADLQKGYFLPQKTVASNIKT